MLSRKELNKLDGEVRRKLKVHCDAYHQHSAKCLIGPKEWQTIALLLEHIKEVESCIRSISGCPK